MNKSKIGQLIDVYDAVQGEFKDKFGRKMTMSTSKKLWSKDTWFYLQHKGEHQIQSSAFIAKLMSTPVKINGKDSNLWEAYEVGDNGKVRIKKGTTLNGKDISNELVLSKLQSDLHRVNKDMHGVYNSFDSPLLERYSVGQLLMMYRKFVVPGFVRRFGDKRVDLESGDILEGHYKTFWRLMTQDIKELRKFVVPGGEQANLTSLEQENIKRFFMEAGIISFLMAFSLLLNSIADGEDDDSLIYYPYYLAYRTRAELMFFINPLDTIRMFRSPAVSYSILEKMMRLTNQVFSPFEEYERDAGLAKKGDNKLKIKTLKLLGINGYTLNPESALQVLQMNQ